MNLELSFLSCFCATEKFIINGFDADYDDFGEKYDSQPEDAEEYACGNMQFFPKQPTKEILEKYGITNEEYNEVTERLCVGLSFGSCGWCV